MIELTYRRATDAADAIRRAEGAHAKYLGGGTNLVDLMRETVEVPSALVDVTGLSVEIEETDDGGLMIGAATRNTSVAEHPAVRTRYPVLTRADEYQVSYDQAARNVTAWLLNRGWAEPDIARVIGGNVLRVLRSTAAAA